MGFSSILDDTKEENQDLKNSVPVSDSSGSLPSDFLDTVQSIISDYCIKFEIENMQKAAALQWKAACQYVGMWAKNNRFYIDKQKTATQGGSVYDPVKIADAVPVWAFLCATYKKTPLVSDFIDFVGVSRSWFYDCNGHCDLTSAGGLILKKVNEIQSTGLASGIVDGRENPTGKIYFSKAVLGWSEDGRRRDDLQGQNENLQSFPDLAGLLPKKDG